MTNDFPTTLHGGSVVKSVMVTMVMCCSNEICSTAAIGVMFEDINTNVAENVTVCMAALTVDRLKAWQHVNDGVLQYSAGGDNDISMPARHIVSSTPPNVVRGKRKRGG